MNELNNLREMIVKGMDEMRATKRKTTSTFGMWYWLFALTVQCNKAIKEVASRLYKMERVINQNIKLKTEEGIDNKQYWKSTRTNLYKISERMMRIGEKLRKF